MYPYPSQGLLLVAIATILAARLPADEYQLRVVASGLERPTGIVIRGNKTLYFTEVPVPGVAGKNNSVNSLNLRTGEMTVLHEGEPEPTNITLDHCGDLYWTCKSAGVILTQTRSGETSVLLNKLAKPNGIAADLWGNIYFTELPTPGVSGKNGGMNTVKVFDEDDQTVLVAGDPEPTDIAVDWRGNVYWTCRSAGVILVRSEKGEVKPVLTKLTSPVGIDLDYSGRTLYWTEVPTPGVPGSMGGKNKIWEYDLWRGKKTLVHEGDPEPTDITVARNGNLYWTCTSAGVIVEAKENRRRGH